MHKRLDRLMEARILLVFYRHRGHHMIILSPKSEKEKTKRKKNGTRNERKTERKNGRRKERKKERKSERKTERKKERKKERKNEKEMGEASATARKKNKGKMLDLE